MTPERWEQINQVFHRALECDPALRGAFFDEVGAADAPLRNEIESLLASHESAESFIETPASDLAAELLAEDGAFLVAGQMVGPYKIARLLATGGMGEVYLADDTRLGRKIALKLLPPQFTINTDRVRRFEQEARAASALNHPNIVTIHEIGHLSAAHFIATEFIDGETLRTQMSGRRLKVGEALEVATQVASALAAAHEAGIVHRDIKPENIMLRRDRIVKVLDFGLAKLAPPERAAATDMKMPTGQMVKTNPGIVMGTVAYMSPEQARGLELDARTDIWSLGVVLHEMVAGSAPFAGDTPSHVIVSIIESEPPQLSHYADVPAELERIITRALRKNKDERYQTANDLALDLKSLRQELEVDARRKRSPETDPGDREIMRKGGQLPVASVHASDFVDDPGPVLAAPQSEDEVKTQPIPHGETAWKTAWTALSATLRRPQVWIPSVLAVVVLAATLSVLSRLRNAPHVPSTEATYWYNAGTASLRNGAYYQASKALQQAVAKDDKFALAHARLAEAYTELDYSDKANYEVLRARALIQDLSPLPPLDSLYLQAITHTVLREFSAAIESYKEIGKQAPDTEKAQAYIDLGRAYERDDQVDKAKESYQKALQLSPSDAAASLRLGVVCGQLQEFKCADEAFGNAEKLYFALSSQEGLTEVFYQRGFLLKTSEKPAEARIQLEKALELSNTTSSVSQQIRTLLSLSSVSAWAGRTAEAEQQANQATSLAQANRIENQATTGLIWLGNSFLLRGSYEEAEKYYQLGLELARRDNGRRNEALALAQLGSLRMQQRRTDEGLHYIEEALPFFEQGGYRKELSQILTLRGRAYRDKGDYQTALSAFKEQLQLGEQAGDASQVAFAHKEIGSVLANREDFNQALYHFDKSYELNKSLRADVNVGYAAMHRASVLWQIGRYQEAKAALAEAALVAQRPEGDYKHLLASVHMVSGLMEASAWHFREAKAESNRALALAGTQYTPTIIAGKTTISLAQARLGSGPEMRRATLLCEEALELATQTSDPQLIADTLLAFAETMLASGNDRRSLEMALRAQQTFSSFGQLESEWRAWLIAASASRNQQDDTKAHEYASYATDRLRELEQRLGAETYKGYLSRPDVQHFNQRLAQIVTMKG